MKSKESVVIVGGAIMGSQCAWFLRHLGFCGRIVVLEKDPTYRYSSTALSAAGIRTQFRCAFNVEMSLFGNEFIRALPDELGAVGDVGFREEGYLLLGPESTDSVRLADMAMQNESGADVVALDHAGMARKFPFVNTDDLGVATFGRRNEGWIDAWRFLSAVRRWNRDNDVEYLKAEATGLGFRSDMVTKVELADGESIPADWVVNAAGPASARLTAALGIPLPVEPRKRTVFQVRAPLEYEHFPMLFDSSGAWIRPEGDGFICGIAPPPDSDPDATGDFERHHDLFEETLWPALAHRIPALGELRVTGAWAGHYEYNTLDQNGIVGPHSRYSNLLFATGFSGHGVMHAPAVGRGIAEWITAGTYQSIDLSPLGYQRIDSGTPIVETIVY